jgi:hypothetical protein
MSFFPNSQPHMSSHPPQPYPPQPLSLVDVLRLAGLLHRVRAPPRPLRCRRPRPSPRRRGSPWTALTEAWAAAPRGQLSQEEDVM